MSELIVVNISDVKVAPNPSMFVTYALGSCVGICLYDPIVKSAGLAHIMLPSHPDEKPSSQLFRYADTCLPESVKLMEKLGCMRSRMTAKIAGGAKMFKVASDSAFGNIGQRNIEAVKKTLASLHIKILAEDTGADYGRTVYFNSQTGKMTVKSFAKGIKVF